MAKMKKNKIINATFKCIYEQGINGINMRAIAAEAKVNQATVYYYFGNKEKLLIEVMKVLFDRVIYDIKKRYKATDPPLKKLEDFFDSGKCFIENQKEMFVVFIDFWSLSIRNPDMQEMFSKLYGKMYEVCGSILQEGIEKGVFKSHRVDTMAHFIVAYVEGLGLQWHMRKNSFSLDKHFEFFNQELNGGCSGDSEKEIRFNRLKLQKHDLKPKTGFLPYIL
jgi:TetR/AcrR family transcriptional regulator, transcriptional repressor of bet genes